MRTGPGQEEFAQYLHKLGCGEDVRQSRNGLFIKAMETFFAEPAPATGRVLIDPKICVFKEDEVIKNVFGNGRLEDPETLKKCCLLTVRNEDSMELNEKV